MKQYNYKFCPVVKLACGEVHILRNDKGIKFFKWFIYVYKSGVYDPLKERVWVIEYGRPDEEKKECLVAAIQPYGWKNIGTFRKVYSKYLEYISNKS